MAPRATLADLTVQALAAHRRTDVEHTLVVEYCRRNRLRPTPGSVLPHTDPPTDLRDHYHNASQWTLDALVAAFEALVPPAEAKTSGAVFTPSTIATFLTGEAVRRLPPRDSPITVLDPAVGCGALLVAVLTHLARTTGEPAATIASRFTGVDVSADSLHRAHLLLTLATLTLGDPTPPTPTLIHGDALQPGTVPDDTRYTLIVGNPPYVRYQTLNRATRRRLAEHYQVCDGGNFNLYFPFFELAEHHLVADGIAAYITPNGFYTSKSASALRAWLTRNNWLDDVLDFGHHQMFNAMTYTTITFASPHRDTTEEGFGYRRVAGLSGLAGLKPGWHTQMSRVSPHGSGQPWRLVGENNRTDIATIAATGVPLGDLAHLRVGLATLRDRLYLLPRDAAIVDGCYTFTRNGHVHRVEDGATRACIRVSDHTADIDDVDTVARILYPYQPGSPRPTLLDETLLRERFPHAYTYLETVRAELARRDHGTKQYGAWYGYGRSQGLAPLGPKLLTPLYAAQPRFMADRHPDTVFINGLAVVLKADAAVPLPVLQQILNSGVCWYFVESTARAISGGFHSYAKTALSPFGVVTLTESQQQFLLSQASPADKDDLLADLYQIVLPERYRRNGTSDAAGRDETLT